MSVDDPFEVLGLEPTLDERLIKRAYFAGLAKTPPHVDPEGFRRLRKAYEYLTEYGTRMLAFVRAPKDPDAELAAWEERFGAEILRARAEVQVRALGSRATERFIQRVASMRLEDALALKPLDAHGGG